MRLQNNQQSFFPAWQFFRLKLASEILSGNRQQRNSTEEIRRQLHAGEIVEIAGYEISSKLSASIDALNLTDFVSLKLPVYWFEIQHNADAVLSPAKQKIIDFWQQHQGDVHLEQISGPDFWMTQEIAVCDELVDCTTRIFTQGQR